MSLFACFWSIIDLQYTTLVPVAQQWLDISIDFKTIMMISLVTICHHAEIYIIIEYIPHIVHFMPVTHLFCYCKLVPLNPPHLFPSSPHPDTSFLFEVNPSGNSWTTETWLHHYFWNGRRRRLTEDLQEDHRPYNDPFCGSWWTVHPSWHPLTGWAQSCCCSHHFWAASSTSPPGTRSLPKCWFSHMLVLSLSTIAWKLGTWKFFAMNLSFAL